MPSLNFKAQFVPLIENGAKRQTIRENTPHWKKLKAGDNLYFFTGLRTKNSKRIVPDFAKTFYNFYENRCAVTCKSVEEIRLSADEHWITLFRDNGAVEQIYNPNEIAEQDGFDNLEDFWNFFKSNYGLPFEGVIIKW
jgi:hypothetical protein